MHHPHHSHFSMRHPPARPASRHASRMASMCLPRPCAEELAPRIMAVLMSLLLLQVWVKPSAEMQFLYGNNILKSGLARITENTPAYTGGPAAGVGRRAALGHMLLA